MIFTSFNPSDVRHVETTISDSTQLDSDIIEIMDSHHIAGVAATVIKDCEIVWKRNYGWANIEKQQKVDESTIFTLGSVSKTITATALMQLWEKGYFGIHHWINNYLPEDVQIINPFFPDDNITFFMLLTHTSSIQKLRRPDVPISLGDSDISLEQFLKDYLVPGGPRYTPSRYDQDSIPGSEFLYTNNAFALIAYLVERISQKPFDQYCNENIFEPLGMKETSWYLADMDTSKLAQLYNWDDSLYTTQGHHGSAQYPAACLKTSSKELSNFLISYMQEGIFEGKSILDYRTVNMMLTCQFGFSPGYNPEYGHWYRGQGLCWYEQMIDFLWLWGHAGHFMGGVSRMFYNPKERWGFIAFSNTGFEDDSEEGLDIIMQKLSRFAEMYGRYNAHVYAGDTDNNGIVNEMDLLPIGVYFQISGTERENASLAWEPQEIFTWNPVAATFADANGDSVVDERDVLALGINWGNTHDQTSKSYAIDPTNKAYLKKYENNFRTIYHSINGESEAMQSVKSLLESILDIEHSVPENFVLYQNYPNPFNPQTTIKFDLPKSQQVSLTIYNILGQVIAKPILDQKYEAGTHELMFNGSALSSGIYLYQIHTDQWQKSNKMVVLK